MIEGPPLTSDWQTALAVIVGLGLFAWMRPRGPAHGGACRGSARCDRRRWPMTGHLHPCRREGCGNTCACTCADPSWRGWECPACTDQAYIDYLEAQELARIASGRPLVLADLTDLDPLFHSAPLTPIQETRS
jgi:hypothetical protein